MPRPNNAGALPRVAFIGNLASVAFAWVQILRKKGLPADIFLTPSEWTKIQGTIETQYGEIPDWVNVFPNNAQRLQLPNGGLIGQIKRQVELISTARELETYDVVHSFTGALFQSIYATFRFGLLKSRPYIATATGSDVREKAFEKSIKGAIIRFFFRRSARTLLLNIDLIDNAKKLRMQNWVFFPFLIDTALYSPGDVPKLKGMEKSVLYFMPTNIDWGLNDKSRSRKSTKGNNRFIEAFAHYIKGGGNARLLLVDRGPDKEAAKELVAQLGINDRVKFIEAMKRPELIKYYRMADVVVDQFDIGSFGATALEVMACARPCMIYINQDQVRRCYKRLPPVVNARSTADILSQIERLESRELRQKIGVESRKWIERYHNADRLADTLIELYQQVAHR